MTNNTIINWEDFGSSNFGMFTVLADILKNSIRRKGYIMIKNRTPSHFASAALPSIIQHISVITRDHPGYITDDTVRNFFDKNVNMFLSSIGVSLNRGDNVSQKVFDKYTKMFNKFREKTFLSSSEIIIDSAGYQYQTGYIKKEDTETFIDLFHNFLNVNEDRINKAFLFDPVPGPTDTVLDSFEEMEKFNAYSYGKASELSQSIRDKLFYIHHFRTPQIRKMYTKFLNEYKFADNFTNFATGGLVSFAKSSQGIAPIVLYCIPLVDIISHAKERGLKKLRWHTLGNSEWKDILFHRFAAHHIKKVHGIDVEITSDSSTLFQCLFLGRYAYVADYSDKSLRKMFINSNRLHQGWKNRGKVEDIWYDAVNKIAIDYGFRKLHPDVDPIYEDGRIGKLHYGYGMFHMLELFNTVEKWCDEYVKELYPIYEAGDELTFNNEISKILRRFNNDNKSKSLATRQNSFYNSLDFLTRCDIDQCDYFVDMYMSGDECRKLQGNQPMSFSDVEVIHRPKPPRKGFVENGLQTF